MRKAIVILAMAAVTVLAGCASGPEFAKAQNSITPLASNKGRIFIYRSTGMGAAIQPDVLVNGVIAGTSKGNGIFYVDRDPGNVEVVIGTEVEKHLTFTLAAGNVRYVKCDVNMGLFVAHIIPILVDEKDAIKEISDLAFIGGK
jgi:hypothetical protein